MGDPLWPASRDDAEEPCPCEECDCPEDQRDFCSVREP